MIDQLCFAEFLSLYHTNPKSKNCFSKSPSNTGTYFAKLKKPGVMNIINRNKSLMEPFGEMGEQALLDLHTHVVNADPFSQQENDKVQTELSATVSDLVEHDENLTGDATILKNFPLYQVTHSLFQCLIMSLTQK